MKTKPTTLPEEQLFPGQEQLPADAVQQVMALSRSLYRTTASVFAELEDRRLHFNHPFPRARGYSPHHCPACGLLERATELLFAYHGHVGAFVRRVLRDPALGGQIKAAVRMYAWEVVQFSKVLGLARDPSEQLARTARVLYSLVPERFVEGQWTDEVGGFWEEAPLLFPLDEMIIECMQEFVATYSSLVSAFDDWCTANPGLCPALFAWAEASDVWIAGGEGGTCP